MKQAVEAEGPTCSSRDNELTFVARAKRRAQRESRAGKSVTGMKPQWHSVQALQAKPARPMKQVRTQAVILASPQEVVVKQ